MRARVDVLHSPPPGYAEQPSGFWQSRSMLLALVLLSAVPLLWPTVPPLTDLPGHIGRYKIALDLADSPALQRFYTFEWALVGNLGVDLLVMALAPLLGLELAVKLIVLAIPPMTVAGFLWVAREVHGRVPPTALFAIPFAYGYPFLFGFVNFALSMALAFLAFALWLRLARLGKLKMRAAIAVPISLVIWTAHAFGWGVLGVLAFSAELVRQIDRGKGLLAAGWHAGLHCIALAPPMALMLLWRSEADGGGTGDWFNIEAKLFWIVAALRDRWAVWDIASLALIALLLRFAFASPRLEFSRNLAASVIFIFLTYLLLPRIVFGSAYADMRLAPYLFALAVIAIRLREGAGLHFAKRIAIVALIFVGARIAGNTISLALYDRDFERQLAALDRVPVGARLVSFVGRNCEPGWSTSRFEHLPALAIVRREAFSNDQWQMPGAQLLRVDYPPARGFDIDPSQIVVPSRCPNEAWRDIDDALRTFPRTAFDYVWLIDPPTHDAESLAGLRPVWRSGTSLLYRVDRAPSDAPRTDED